jgi:hypothetical protein
MHCALREPANLVKTNPVVVWTLHSQSMTYDIAILLLSASASANGTHHQKQWFCKQTHSSHVKFHVINKFIIIYDGMRMF